MATLDYIDDLPKQSIRSLNLHFDNTGYYIIWDYTPYYKLRLWDSPDLKSRYKSPLGHSKPVFAKLVKEPSRLLVIVEGEINALSLAEAEGNFDIISPGGVSSFTDGEMLNELNNLDLYDTVLICTDQDQPGLKAALTLKKLLLAKDKLVFIKLMEKDFNQLLQDYGKEKFKEEVKSEFQRLGMPEQLRFK